MKVNAKLQFGLSVNQAGQKSATVNALPTLTVNSTKGKFVVTAPVSKALGIAVGENIMFVNNIQQVEDAIQRHDEVIVDWATENDVDLDTREGQDAALEEWTQWYIAKGIKEYDKTGSPVYATERFTKEDKAKYLENHREELVAANRDALVAEFGELSDEELAEKLTVDMVESPKYHSAKGSKTATTSSSTGVGCQLNFTDTAIWEALKADLGEDKERKNRVFDVDLKNAAVVSIHDGYKDVDVTVAPIVYKEDLNPVVREKKD